MDTHQAHGNRKSENVWNFIFSIFFIVVLAGALWLMKSVRGGYLNYVPPFDALLISLAAFRITRLVVYDKISRWFRDLFEDPTGEAPHGLRHTIHDLLGCPWCIGFWSALVLVVAYFIFTWAWTVIFFLAVAGVGSLVQLYANSLGWRAENLKLDAKEKEMRLGTEVDRTSLGK